MALSPFDFDDKAGNAIIGGQSASAGMGVQTPGLRVSGGIPSAQQVDANIGASAQNLLNSVQTPAPAPQMQVVGFNPQTREVFAGGRAFNVDDVAMTSTALQKGFFDRGVDAIPEGFGKMSLQEVRQYITERANDTSGTHAKDLWVDLKRGVAQLPGTVTGVADAVTGAMGMGRPVGQGWEEAGKLTGFQPGQWADQMTPQYSAGRQNQNIAINNAWDQSAASGIGETLKNPGYLAGQVVQSLPGMAVGGLGGRALAMGTKMAPAVGAGIGEGAVMAGQSMEQMTKNGVDPQRAGMAALGIGAVGGAIGAGSGALATKMGLPDIDAAIAGGSMASRLPLKQRMPLGAFQEGVLEELPQSLLEQGAQNWAEGNPLTQGMARAGFEGTAAGSIMGGAFQAFAKQGKQLDALAYAGEKQKEEQGQLALPAPEGPAGYLPAPRQPLGNTMHMGGPQGPADGGGGVSSAEQANDQMWAERDANLQQQQVFQDIARSTIPYEPTAIPPSFGGNFQLQDQQTGIPFEQTQVPQAPFQLEMQNAPGMEFTPSQQPQPMQQFTNNMGAPGSQGVLDFDRPFAPMEQMPGVNFERTQAPQQELSLAPEQSAQQDGIPFTQEFQPAQPKTKKGDVLQKARAAAMAGEITAEDYAELEDMFAQKASWSKVAAELEARKEKARAAQTPAPAQAPVVASQPAAAPATKSEQLKQRAKAKKQAAPAQPPAVQTVAQQLGAANASPDQEHADAVDTKATAAKDEQKRDAQTNDKKSAPKGTGRKAKQAKEEVAADSFQTLAEQQQKAEAKAQRLEKKADKLDNQLSVGDPELVKAKAEAKAARGEADRLLDAANKAFLRENPPKQGPKRSTEVDDAEEAVADEQEYADLPDILDEVDRLSNAADLDMLDKKDRATLKNRLNYLQSLVDDTTVPEHLRTLAQEAIAAAPKDLVNEVKRQQKAAEGNREHREGQRARDKAALVGIVQKLYLSPAGRKAVKLLKDWMAEHKIDENFTRFVQDLMSRRWNGDPIQTALMPAVEYLEERVVAARAPENAQYGVDKGWADVHDLIRDAKSLGEALKRTLDAPFAKGWQKTLIRALLNSKAVRDAAMVLNPEYVPSETSPDALALGHYDYEANKVYLHNGGGLQSLLHEAIHAAVYNKMEADDGFRKAISNLFLKAQKHISGDQYGMTDIQEFVAEAFTNPEFQAELAKIPSTGIKSAGSLWDAFVDLVRVALKLFGVQRSLLDDVISVTAPHIGDDTPTPPKGTKRPLPERAVPKAVEKLQQASGVLTGSKTMEHQLNWMTLRQIKDKFGHMLDGLKDYIDTTFARASATNERNNRLTSLAEKIDKHLRKDAVLGDILLKGDELEVDVRPGANRKDALSRYKAKEGKPQSDDDAASEKAVQALIEKYDAMSPEAKQLYAEARDFFDEQAKATHNAMVNMITTLIRDPVVRAARLADLNKWYSTRIKGYFPHVRFGDFIVSYRDRDTGAKVVEMYETEREALAAFEEAKAEKHHATTMRRRTNTDANGFDLINDLNAAVDALKIGDSADAVKQQMKDALQEVYIKSLPEYSGAKFRLRRSKVKGYSGDIVRAMTAQGSRMSRHISRMEHMPLMNAALATMNDSRQGKPHAYVVHAEVDGKPFTKVFRNRLELQQWMDTEGTRKKSADQGGQMIHQKLAFSRVESVGDAAAFFAGGKVDEADRPMAEVQKALDTSTSEGGNFTKQDTLYNHIKKLIELEANNEGSPVINAVTQAAWVYHLGLTPSFAFINLLQTPAMFVPWLASRKNVGMGKAFKHTMAAYGVVTKNLGSLAKATWREDVLKALEGKVAADEMDMLREMMRRNLIDFTTSYDLMAMTKGTSGMSDLTRKGLKVSSYMAQYSEVVNRMVTALAAYNAGKEAGHTNLNDLVERALAETQGDYSPENTAYMMDRRRSGPLSFLFQFQKYRQFTLYGLIDNTTKAFKGDKEARALVLGWLVSNGALFGTLGMPVAVPILWAIAAATKDDDEPVDIQRMLRTFYTGATGSEKMAEVMSHGALRMLGMSVTGRAGMGDILPGSRAMMDPKQTSEKDSASAWATFFADTFAGAAGGMFNNAASAAGFFADGQFGRGVEALSPKAVKDVAKAMRFHNEGVRSRDGTTSLMEQVGMDGIILQAIGLTPAEVANVYEKRGSLQAIEQFLNNGQTKVKHAYVRAAMFGDEEDMAKAIDKWQQWNDTHQSKSGMIPYGELLRARNTALRKEKEMLQSSGLYSTKQGRQIAADYGLE